MNALGVSLAVLLLFPAAVGLSILSTIWRAWWLYPAWGWFIVPLGLPAITLWHLTALILLINILTAHPGVKKDDRPTDWWSAILTPILWPPTAWAILRWLAP